MKLRRTVALAGMIAVLGLIGGASALAAGTRISVRVEGLKKTLLAAKTVRTPTGDITKGGAPAGSCPASNAAGALEVATKHRWTGSYSSGLGIEVTSILGEIHKYSPHGYYWGIWVDNRFASAGICDLKPHPGEQILFAPAPATGTVYPIVLSAPQHVTAGRSFTVKTSYYKGKTAKPLAGVSFNGMTGKTDNHGKLSLKVQSAKPGTVSLVGSEKGYIRSEAATVKVIK